MTVVKSTIFIWENIMELSENTLSVLKNFSTINQNIIIKQGNDVKTISEARNVVAKAIIDESFDSQFGIYDLNEFINVLGLVDTPRLKFSEDFVTIGDSTGRSKVKYYFSAQETLTSPQKDVIMPDVEVEFTLTNDTLNKLKRAASTLGHTELSISNKNGVLCLSIVDSQNTTSNTFSMDVDGKFEPTVPFNFVLNIPNLKIISGDYDVSISSKLISQFKHKEKKVLYWIALEKTSTYGE